MLGELQFSNLMQLRVEGRIINIMLKKEERAKVLKMFEVFSVQSVGLGQKIKLTMRQAVNLQQTVSEVP